VVDTDTGLIEDRTRGQKYQARPIPPFMQELVRDGGLIEHIKKKMKGEERKAQGARRKA
jgi:3-isopropylmalate/(R)-2-methylmalate dehydratase small subunit